MSSDLVTPACKVSDHLRAAEYFSEGVFERFPAVHALQALFNTCRRVWSIIPNFPQHCLGSDCVEGQIVLKLLCSKGLMFSWHVNETHFLRSACMIFFHEQKKTENNSNLLDARRPQSVALRFHSVVRELTPRYKLSLSMRSASLQSRAPRAEASLVLHSDPSSKALRAACTAFSTSACCKKSFRIITLRTYEFHARKRKRNCVLFCCCTRGKEFCPVVAQERNFLLKLKTTFVPCHPPEFERSLRRLQD